MEQLLSVFAYWTVVARGLSLSLQTLLIGANGFLFFVLKPSLGSSSAELQVIQDKIRLVLFWAATALGLIGTIDAATNTSVLMSTAKLRFTEVVGAQFFAASLCIVLACISIAVIARAGWKLQLTLPFTMAILLGTVITGHAWSRIEHRLLLGTFDLVHQGAAGIWIGGLPVLLIALGAAQDSEAANTMVRRYSRMAVIAVALLFAAGVALSAFYIDTPDAVYGTAYGIMLLSKVVFFLVLLGIGAMNRSIVNRINIGASSLLKLLRRNVEAEIGIGFTVVLAAASLTSQPPAVDLPNNRLSASEIRDRYAPRGPRLHSPDVSQLKTPAKQLLQLEAKRTGRPITYVPGSPPLVPDTPAGKAWSEYNHNWAGLVVLAIGVLLMGSRSQRMRWTRNWPLLFIALAVFILLRADPENWPLGPNGFWASFLEADVLQHRFFALLIIAFAVFEWRVQTGRARVAAAAYAFPLVCAIGGALLLTHSHSLGNTKEETLVEWSHIPLAFFAVLAGWSRWAELRSEAAHRNVLGWICSVSFVMIGAVLLLYREM